MKIGDEVYVHGFVDEIRKDLIIIRNDGGYFGTATNEVLEKPMQESSEDCISRQAVLDLVNADWKYEGLEEPIKSMPPAQLEYRKDQK